MTYDDFETKMEAKGWIPTPRDMAESLKTVQHGPNEFEATRPEVSENPIWDTLTQNFNPFELSMNLKNHIAETIEWANSQLDSMWFAVDYHHHWYNPRRQPQQLAITNG